MLINKIQTNQYNYNSSFKAYNKTVYDAVSHRFKYDTTTCFFRRDLDWKKFFNFLFQKYKNTDKVTVISHAASDCEEAYSLAIGFLSGGNAGQKFLPVIAKDIDINNLNIAGKGIYNVGSVNELERIRSFTGQDYEKYFQVLSDKENRGINSCTKIFNDTDFIKIKLSNMLKKNVYFEQADILKDIFKLPQENTVLMLRNVWPYLKLKDMRAFAEVLANHLKSSSTLAIGLYDACWKVEDKLLQSGFKKTPVRFVYEL